MQLAHNAVNEVVSSKAMRHFESKEFFKKKSYFFMHNAGKQSFKFITTILKKKTTDNCAMWAGK